MVLTEAKTISKAKGKRQQNEDYAVRIPVEMIQCTKKDGVVHPLLFYWQDNPDDTPCQVEVDRIISITPEHQRSSGLVGDRYEVEIDGKRELLYYSKLQPRKWFRVVYVSKEVYEQYFKLPGES